MSGAKVGIAAVVGLVLGGIGGVVGGTALGAKGGAMLLGGNWADTEARNTDETIEVLRKFRAKKTEEAIQDLEAHLNHHIYGLMPATREGLSLPENVITRLNESKARAKAYRTDHPQPESPNLLSKDVAKFLAGD